MRHSKDVLVLLGLLILGITTTLQAASDASFPEGWENWTVVTTGLLSRPR